MWDKVRELISDVAPEVGVALGGPLGGIAGKVIATALGVEEKPEAIVDALKNNPDALLKVKELESNEHITAMNNALKEKEMYLDSEKANLATVTSAQEMQGKALAQEDNFSKQFIYWFAIGWSLFGMCYIIAITFLPIPQSNIRFSDTILGFLLGTAISGILQFFFGSSAGSRKAQEALMEKVK